MTKNFIYAIIGVLLTILIFSGIFASLPRKKSSPIGSTPLPQAVQEQTNVD